MHDDNPLACGTFRPTSARPAPEPSCLPSRKRHSARSLPVADHAFRAGDRERATAVGECVKLCREYTNLETLLGIDQDRVYDVNYNTPPLRTSAANC